MAPELNSGTWRPFLCNGCRHPPDATYPDGSAGNALRVTPRAIPIRFCSRWGLQCRRRRRRRGGLLPRHFTLTTEVAVCFLLHFPWGYPRRKLSGTVFPWSPDFPHELPFGNCPCGRPAGWQYRIKGLRGENATGKAVRGIRHPSVGALPLHSSATIRGSCAWPHVLHCTSIPFRRWNRLRDYAPWRDISYRI
jgi:hypothetical protein